MAAKKKETGSGNGKSVSITAPNLKFARFKIRGNVPYVQCKFSYKSMMDMKATQEAGSTAKKGKKKDPKDFDALYLQAMHESDEGWRGIPATAFRNGMISACKLVGYAMTRGKLSLFCVADGYDKNDRTPLVRFTKGEPHKHEQYVRNATGVADIRAQAMWEAGWEMDVTICFDADEFTEEDVANLMMRVGLQVGVGCGRPDSKQSAGMGFGTFDLVQEEG